MFSCSVVQFGVDSFILEVGSLNYEVGGMKLPLCVIARRNDEAIQGLEVMELGVRRYEVGVRRYEVGGMRYEVGGVRNAECGMLNEE